MTHSNINHIYEFVYNNQSIDKQIKRLVKPDLQKDMKQYLIIILDKINRGKLVKLYHNKGLIPYMMKIIYYNTSRECNNCFSSIYYPVRLEEVTPEMQIIEPVISPNIDSKFIQDIFEIILTLPVSGRRRLSLYEIFSMIYIQGYSISEVAKIKNVPLQSVKNWKTRALKDIKIILTENGYNPNQNIIS